MTRGASSVRWVIGIAIAVVLFVVVVGPIILMLLPTHSVMTHQGAGI